MKVILFNHSDDDFEFDEGDRVAQVIFEKIAFPVEVEEVLELSQTTRGEAGIGSTGVAPIKE